MDRPRASRRIWSAGAVILAAVLVAACAVSPRPDTTATAPPVPAGTTPLGQVTWTSAVVPAGLGEEASFSDAAAGPTGFVIVGDTGAFGFQGIVLRSTDGRAWATVHDNDVTVWGLSKVIATDRGYMAIGGRFSGVQADGTTAWTSAILTSSDGSDWTVRQTFDGMDILTVAARGPLIIATTDAGTLLVSRNAAVTWQRVLAGGVGFGAGSPSAVAVLGTGRWVAVGTMGASAAAWISADGLTWEPATMEAAGPVPGIKSVTPYAIAAGTSVAVATGTDDPQDCAPGDDFCAHFGAAWTTTDGRHWMRLPRGTPLTGAPGGGVWPAGAAGVVSILPDLSQSANGWSWTTVPGSSPDIPFGAFVIHGRTVIAAGLGVTRDTPALSILVGTIAGR